MNRTIGEHHEEVGVPLGADSVFMVTNQPNRPRGRPRREVDLQRIYDAWQRHRGIRLAARELGLPPGTLWTKLTDAGFAESGSGDEERTDSPT